MRKTLALFVVLAGASWAQQIEGNWLGAIQTGAIKLRIGVEISRSPAGELSAKLDSIDQGVRGIPIRQITFSNNRLHLDMPNLHAVYDGTLAGDEIHGTFTQGAALPLDLKRVASIQPIVRPQTPKPPFPYDSIDVSYQDQGIKLAGTLTVPHGAGPFPAALMITGSGPQDRDETLMGHKPFLVIADFLSRRGFAVLRVDDRGMGQSTGDSRRTTISGMAGDVLAGIAFLKSRKEIDPRHIGVIGHSEGGIVGPLAASQSADIAFVVMLAGPGVTGEQVLYAQSELVIRASGAGDAAVAANRALQEMIFGVLKAEQNEKDEQVILQKLREAWTKRNPTASTAANRQMEAQFASVVSPEIRSFLFFDPAAVLAKLKVPVLAMNGSRDVQVSARQNLPAIVAALAAGGNPDFTAVELPGLNHLFQKCKTCAPSEYGDLEETFSPEALDVLGNWLARHK